MSLCQTNYSGTRSSVNLLVVGSESCGKTAFIRALVQEQGSSSSSSTQVTVKDQSYSVHFTELSLDDVDFSSVRRIEWPRYVNGTPFPELIDGVFCLYDVSDKESVADVPTALSKYCTFPQDYGITSSLGLNSTVADRVSPASMTNSGLPCMLLASKCDVKQESRQVNPKFHEQIRRNLANVAIAEVSIQSPESAKLCLLAMIDRVLTSPRSEWTLFPTLFTPSYTSFPISGYSIPA